MNSNQYRKWYFKQLRVYERTSNAIVTKHLKNSLVKFGRSNPTRETMSKLLRKSVTDKMVLDMLAETYITVGGTHGNKIVKGIKDNTLQVKRIFTSLWIESFAKDVLKWLGINGGDNIKSIRKTFIKTVLDYIAKRNDEGKSIQVVTNEIIKNFGKTNGLYKSQIKRIVRTETGSAANYASWKAMESSEIVIDKMWLSADDDRTRDGISKKEYNHRAMNGVTIPHGELFKVPNQDGISNNIMYPIDMIRGDAGNVINCRCTTAPVPRRDKNGRLVLKK